jgi:hypothetical protein
MRRAMRSSSTRGRRGASGLRSAGRPERRGGMLFGARGPNPCGENGQRRRGDPTDRADLASVARGSWGAGRTAGRAGRRRHQRVSPRPTGALYLLERSVVDGATHAPRTDLDAPLLVGTCGTCVAEQFASRLPVRLGDALKPRFAFVAGIASTSLPFRALRDCTNRDQQPKDDQHRANGPHLEVSTVHCLSARAASFLSLCPR